MLTVGIPRPDRQRCPLEIAQIPVDSGLDPVSAARPPAC